MRDASPRRFEFELVREFLDVLEMLDRRFCVYWDPLLAEAGAEFDEVDCLCFDDDFVLVLEDGRSGLVVAIGGSCESDG